MSFTVNVSNRVRVRLSWLSDAEQQELGAFSIETMIRRIRGGVGINDQPAAPLTESRRRSKLRHGLSGIRDLTESGAMLGNIQVIGTGDAIRIGFTDPRQALKAGVNQDRSPQLGLSRFDQKQVIEKHDEMLLRPIAEILYKLTA